MGNDTSQWRAAIGCFALRRDVSSGNSDVDPTDIRKAIYQHYFCHSLASIILNSLPDLSQRKEFFNSLVQILLVMAGIEQNPGPLPAPVSKERKESGSGATVSENPEAGDAELMKICCDPHWPKNHLKKPITKDLRLMSDNHKLRFNLDCSVLYYWCSTCRKQKSASSDAQPEVNPVAYGSTSDLQLLSVPNPDSTEVNQTASTSIRTDNNPLVDTNATRNFLLAELDQAEDQTSASVLQFSGILNPDSADKGNQIASTSKQTEYDNSLGVTGSIRNLVEDETSASVLQFYDIQDFNSEINSDQLQSASQECDGGSSHVNSNSELHGNSTPMDYPRGTLKCSFDEESICSEELITVDGLIKDEKKAFKIQAEQCNRNLSEMAVVCSYHYQLLVGQFKEGHPIFIDKCCDPLGTHFKRIQSGLRTVGVTTILEAKVNNYELIYGEKICRNCLDIVRVVPHSASEQTMEIVSEEISEDLNTQKTTSSDTASLSQSVKKERAKKFLTALGLPPLVLTSRTLEGRITYGKRTLDEAAEIVKKKICCALDLPKGSLDSCKPQKSIDMDLLLEEIAAEMPTASRARKYQLLSLVPLSISLNEACRMFNVSKTLVKRARDIRIQYGILPTLKISRLSSVLDSTKELIVKFYLEDTNSKLLPGKRDCVSVSKCVYEQKRLMLCSVGELYASFQKVHPNLKVGKSIFYKLKPIWCVFPGSSGTHSVCVCQIHEDVRLIIHSLGIKTYYRDLISQLVCNEESETCMLRLCQNCFTIPQIVDCFRGMILKELAENASSPEYQLSDVELEEFWDQSIEFYQWKNIDGQTELITQVSKRIEVLEIGGKKMNDMIPHEFIARSQAKYVKNLMNNLPINKVVIQMDFAMNFSCLFPKEIQSYHWSKKQVTMHPVVIYYRPNAESEVKHHCIFFISDDLTHDVAMVKVFIAKTMAILKEKFPHLTEVEYVTDGCGAQYKNKISFWNLCQHLRNYGVKATHSFYATSHGKSLCDALSGIIKRLVSAACLQCTLDNLINSAIKVFEYCKNHPVANVQFEFVTKVEVDLERSQTKDANELEVVPGTRSFHYYEPLSENSLGCKRVSQNSTFSLVHCLEKGTIPPAPSFSPGTYVIVRTAGRRYVGFLSDININESEAEVSLLRPHLPTDLLTFPEDLNTMIVPLPHLLCTVSLRELPEDKYEFTDEDKDLLTKLRIVRRRRK